MKKQYKKEETKSALDIITDQIIQQLESGTIPWKKTWNNSPQNISGHNYRGINRLLLGMLNYYNPYFLTFKQVQELGGYVKRGEHSYPVVFWKTISYSNSSSGDDGDIELCEKTVPFMRYYRVFNITQTEGIDLSKFTYENDHDDICQHTSFVQNWTDCPVILHRGSQPCYSPRTDTVEVPFASDFNSSDAYYQTLFHELIHSTGHQSRCNRKEIAGLSMFGSESYSLEELVAEIGACFLCSHSNIKTDIKNSAAYIQNWLSVLKNDKKMIITAAARAEKAFQYILEHQASQEATEPIETMTEQLCLF